MRGLPRAELTASKDRCPGFGPMMLCPDSFPVCSLSGRLGHSRYGVSGLLIVPMFCLACSRAPRAEPSEKADPQVGKLAPTAGSGADRAVLAAMRRVYEGLKI